jgi:GNAT superfamily N-acetyltransferase
MLQTPTKTSHEIYLRQASEHDVVALAALRRASLLEQNLLPPEDAAAFERAAARELQTLFAEERLAAWLLVVDERVAGSACVVFWQRLPYAGSSLHAELSGVFVETPFRRRGFARELCREAIAAARARGARRIVVHPSSAGRELYRELGFNLGNEMRLEP